MSKSKLLRGIYIYIYIDFKNNMKTIISDDISEIVRKKKLLEKRLKVTIEQKGNDLEVDGEPLDEYIAEKVIEALDFGFPMKAALSIKDEDYEFEKLRIKDFTRRSDLSVVRGRIIGTGGKTLKTLSDLTKCFFEIKNNEVGIIGRPEEIKNAQESIISLIKGTKQANVYRFLEKHQPKPIIDYGIIDKKKNQNNKL
jgi:ribosomal RNA assembly protein